MLKESLFQSLSTCTDKQRTTVDPVELVAYETDAGLGRGHPDAVVFPESKEEAARIVSWAAAERVPIVPRTAGTGLSGGAVPSHGGVVVSFARLNRVVELDHDDRTAVVQPGVINLALDSQVRLEGLYYPPDPASQRACSIGGNIAENAGGPHCFKYGVTTNYVMDLEVVLADGKLVHTAGRALDYPGYDFTGLLTGSEGMLALVTQAVLRLQRNPPAVKTMTATFDSVEAAGRAVSAIIARGLVPAALEMMDRNIIGIIEDYRHAGLPTDAAALLLIEVDGYPASLDAQIAEIVEVLNAQGSRRLHICQTAAERDQIWAARKSAFGAMARLSPAYYQVDGTVPRSKLSNTLAAIQQFCSSRDLRVGFVFHAGDGNLHPLMPFDPADADMVKKVFEVGHEFLELCVAQNGTITGEHGVGIEKREFMPLMYSPDEMAAMAEVKQVFDPLGILNPGKVLPVTMPARSVPFSQSQPTSLPPLCVPETEEEAAETIHTAQFIGRPVLIRGASTTTLQPDSGAMILSTEKLRGIVAFAPEDLYITVRAGTPLTAVQAALAEKGLWTPILSPWQTSTVGGIISAALNSPLRMRYGAVRDQVLELRVILPDGRHVHFGRPVVKNVAGFDMVKLFVGAKGTLGLITQATLRLTALPRARRTLLVPIQDLTAIGIGRSLLRASLVASAVLLCKNCTLLPGAEPTPYALVFTVEGHPLDVTAELNEARATLASAGTNTAKETEATSGSEIWASFLRREPSHVRVGLPRKYLSSYLSSNESRLGSSFVADLANGLIYAAPRASQLPTLRQAALATGGYCVAIGSAGELDPGGYIPDTLSLMQQLKQGWDPGNYLNPKALYN